jgi:very-short-patch-repair endonuclease
MLYKDGTLLDLQGQPIKPAAVRAVRGFQRRAIKKLTPAESAFCRLIGPVVQHGRLRYVKQVVYYVAPGISFRSDFVFKDYLLIVEIDGPEHAAKKSDADAWRDRLLMEFRGMRTLRVTNRECLEEYLLVREKVIDALLASPRGWKKGLLEYRNRKRIESAGGKLTEPAAALAGAEAGLSEERYAKLLERNRLRFSLTR